MFEKFGLFRVFEGSLHPTASTLLPPTGTDVRKFYFHFISQARWAFFALLGASVVNVALEISVPWFIGQLIDAVTTTPPNLFFIEHWWLVFGMASAVFVGRPLAYLLQALISNSAITPNFTSLIRWQSHLKIARQSMAFFQADAAGAIAARVMETGNALRQTAVTSITAFWGILIFGATALVLVGSADLWLMLPIIIWFTAYGGLLTVIIPRVQRCARANAFARSEIMSRLVDTYSHILTIKLFGRQSFEDGAVKAAIESHTKSFHGQLRQITIFGALLQTLNGALLVSEGVIAIFLWTTGNITVGDIAMTLPLTLQITSIATNLAGQISDVFENIGIVREGARTIGKPVSILDRTSAKPLQSQSGSIDFNNVTFSYQEGQKLFDHLCLKIRAGERVGIVGPSGAGKSTLVNLILRLYDLDDGQIMIDGQDISQVTQDSLHAAISIVPQDISLLNRTVYENIVVGSINSELENVVAAASEAQAHRFIERLIDGSGNTGYDSVVGERGSRLSGGQRQRIAIARATFKKAPILILDEATSALDSETEDAIHHSLDRIMVGKTVVVIAHRLSTIAKMDRLVVLEGGRIVEMGSHNALLKNNGLYARLWAHQSGGFLGDVDKETMEHPSHSASP
ncbi:ATP-binding cassette domain-containing protein [Agrobacterium vitis]|uniref:ATP-binding cassette domain-containing protein n=1 Tax=Agrobacterium vitis TaxID=373 RepID=A0A6L6VHD0_AGRVI|nr:ABC transporter ATP-binding protein [Agrobacterium vitis]MUZ75270.1 ATP-binding cassette domain-containing protein [Agrobacterium vitis]